MAANVSLRNVAKHFGAVKVVDNISLEIEPGDSWFWSARRAAASQPRCAWWPAWSRSRTAPSRSTTAW